MRSLSKIGSGASDAELLRWSHEDPAAFAELYERHVQGVYIWLAARITWAASDLTAETFARAWLRRLARSVPKEEL